MSTATASTADLAPAPVAPSALEVATETARSHLPVQRRVRHPDFWEPMVIVDKGDRLAVYGADAWTEPTVRPLLPWHAPLGNVVGRVDLDGIYSPA